MPRRRPGAVRAAQRRAEHDALIPGLSRATSHALNRLDRDELRPDAVRAALHQWQVVGRDVRARRRSWPAYAAEPTLGDMVVDVYWMGCPVCGPDAAEMSGPSVRDVLSRAIYALPRRKARTLRRLVHQTDREVRRRTLPLPARAADEQWWHRRLVPL